MTLAHPVAVLPLRRFGLPMAALVIGSMVPDVPLFMGWSSGYQVSHSYTGVFTVNLIGALGGLAIAVGLLVDAAIIMVENIVHRLAGATTRRERRERARTRRRQRHGAVGGHHRGPVAGLTAAR